MSRQTPDDDESTQEDLLYLNRMVVQRLNLLAQTKSTVAQARTPREQHLKKISV